ncbi:MAG TPA: hypothetical protein PLG02_05980 [Methylotenera sp.]|nr:hypothetical protein [Methylotenera sp.]
MNNIKIRLKIMREKNTALRAFIYKACRAVKKVRVDFAQQFSQ